MTLPHGFCHQARFELKRARLSGQNQSQS